MAGWRRARRGVVACGTRLLALPRTDRARDTVGPPGRPDPAKCIGSAEGSEGRAWQRGPEASGRHRKRPPQASSRPRRRPCRTRCEVPGGTRGLATCGTGRMPADAPQGAGRMRCPQNVRGPASASPPRRMRAERAELDGSAHLMTRRGAAGRGVANLADPAGLRPAMAQPSGRPRQAGSPGLLDSERYTTREPSCVALRRPRPV